MLWRLARRAHPYTGGHRKPFTTLVVFAVNAVSARVFGETEYWFSLIKVVAVVAPIVLGGAALAGCGTR
jgi:L-asparagine transporter-like permease